MTSSLPPALLVSADVLGPDRAGVAFRPVSIMGRLFASIGRPGRPSYFPGQLLTGDLVVSAIGADQVEQLADALIDAGQKLRTAFHLQAGQR